MKAALNPFSPGSGRRPPALVGRDDELDAIDVIIERTANGMGSRGILLTGLRGVGKTVLLNEMQSRAEAAGWFVVYMEARMGRAGQASARQSLARTIAVQARHLMPLAKTYDVIKRALQSVTAFNAKVGASGIDLGVQVAPGRGDSGDIEVDLPEVIEDLSRALSSVGKGFMLFIDELQELDEELLRAIIVTQHRAGQGDRWPFFLVGAGLPNLHRLLPETVSYAERLLDPRTIGKLGARDAAAALVGPLAQQDVTIEDAALAMLMRQADGYPYFLQEYGQAVWEVAEGPDITEADATVAVSLGLERLDAGFFRSRWERATKAERRLLVAMAEDGDGPSLSSEVAKRMSLKPTSLGPYRANLINKGLIYAPEHGEVAYTVPGMADYVHRHREDAEGDQ
jgi:hypothetical protein